MRRPTTRRGRATLALVGLAIVALPLAAPGPGMVPAATASSPRWLLGIGGRGFELGGRTYLGLLVAAFLCYLLVVATARHIRPRVMWTATVALVTLFVLAPPLLSRDVFSYIAYGRLGARHGLNPYVAVPAQRPDDPVFPFVGWRNTPGAYGPLFTFAVYPIGLLPVAAAMWALKAVGGLAVLALAAVTAHIAKVRGGDPQRAAAMVALNPLVLVHVVGGAHNDPIMVLALMGSVALLISGRQVRGALALALAIGLKVSGLVAAPFALAGTRRRLRLAIVLAAALAAIGGVAFVAFGSHAWAAERLAGRNQSLTSHYSVPSTLARLTTVSVDRVRVFASAGYAAVVLGLLWWTARGGDWVRATGWAAFGLLVASSWLMPWYVIWALPLAAVARDRRLTGSVLGLCAFQLVNRVPM